jgi:SHS2 domain-containing protein
MHYRKIDHTADLGLDVHAPSLPQLLELSACAMFDQIVNRATLGRTRQALVTIQGHDWPDLMINWLRELLYLWNGHGFLLKSAAILTLSPFTLKARLHLVLFDSQEHSIHREIKAVTYHQANIVRTPENWSARFFFDV